jgi:hypothetical protein
VFCPASSSIRWLSLLASYAPFARRVCGDGVREERGHEPLLERVDQEEGRRDQSDAVCRGVRVRLRLRVRVRVRVRNRRDRSDPVCRGMVHAR